MTDMTQYAFSTSTSTIPGSKGGSAQSVGGSANGRYPKSKWVGTKKGSVEGLFYQEDAARQAMLEESRVAAILTIPSVCPPRDWNETIPLPENYQSLGARGILWYVGKILLATFAPDRPWVMQEAAPEFQYDQNIAPERIASVNTDLFMEDLLILATLESANYAMSRGDLLGFWTIQRQAIAQILVAGDVLQRLDSEFRLTNFRLDQYVTKRTDGGAVSFHVTREGKDPLELTDEQLDMCGLDYSELEKMPYAQRHKRLFTLVEWQPRSKNWVITQELNGCVINESVEPITNHFSTPFDLAPGANYGRGLIAAIRGDLASYDKLSEHTLNFAAAASKHHPILDSRSDLMPDDLEQVAGTVLSDRVEGGKPAFLAMFQAGNLNDFQIVHLAKEQLRTDLGKSLGGVSETVRQSERTTAFEVSEVTLAEATGSLGGVLAPVQDKLQLPLFYRTRHQLRAKGALRTHADQSVRVRVLSGIQAIAAQQKAARILSFADVVEKLDPTGALRNQYLNLDVLLDVLARKQGIYEPGIIRTPQQRAALRQQAMQEQAQQQAAQQAIQSGGKIAENAAAQQIQQGAGT